MTLTEMSENCKTMLLAGVNPDADIICMSHIEASIPEDDNKERHGLRVERASCTPDLNMVVLVTGPEPE